jgi:hypothetical protein
MVGMQIIMGSSPATMPPPQGQKGHWFKLLEDMICKTQKWANTRLKISAKRQSRLEERESPADAKAPHCQRAKRPHISYLRFFFAQQRVSIKINRAEPLELIERTSSGRLGCAN